jgi:hypothetical protein
MKRSSFHDVRPRDYDNGTPCRNAVARMFPAMICLTDLGANRKGRQTKAFGEANRPSMFLRTTGGGFAQIAAKTLRRTDANHQAAALAQRFAQEWSELWALFQNALRNLAVQVLPMWCPQSLFVDLAIE